MAWMQWADTMPSGSSTWGLEGTSRHSCVFETKDRPGQLLEPRHSLRLWKGLYKCERPELWFCANFQLVFGKHSKGGGGHKNRTSGSLRKPWLPQTTEWPCVVRTALSARVCLDLRRGVGLCSCPAAKWAMEPLGGTCGSQECSITPWHGLGSEQGTDFTNGSDSMKKIHQRLKTSRPQNTNAKIFRGMN